MAEPSPSSSPRVSIVVPCLNEEDTIRPLFEQTVRHMEEAALTFEMIFVDDGSTDTTPKLIQELAAEDQRARYIFFRKNFGQTAAIKAGIDHARGEVIVPIDADLQNDPVDIPRLVAKLDDGFDVVSGWRKKRQDAAVKRKLPSRVANWLIAKVTGVHLNDYGCTLKAYRREVVEDIELFGEMHRFIPAIASYRGAKIDEMEVTHHPRRFGETKYGLNRIWKVLLDLLTVKFFSSYLAKPNYFFGGAGFSLLILSGLFAILHIFRRLAFGGAWISPLLFIVIVLTLLGVQFLFTGVLAEILTRIYFSSERKASYWIRETNFESESD